MFKKLDLETKLGGVFGIIAVAAAILEVVLDGFSWAAIAGGIKDIAGTMVAVMVFLIAVRALLPKGKEELPFEKKLEKAINTWVQKHANMIVETSEKTNNATQSYGLHMTTDPDKFYSIERLKSDGGSRVGRFVRLPRLEQSNYAVEKPVITFFLNTQTFCANLDSNDKLEELLDISAKIANYISNTFRNISSESKKENGSTAMIIITFDHPITTDEDIQSLLDVIDCMYQAYLVSASRKVA